MTPKPNKPNLAKPPAGKAVGRVPPPARMPPGIKGSPPIPVGQVTVVEGGIRRPVQVTDMERQHLAAAGLGDKDPVPSNLANILSKVRTEVQATQRDARASAQSFHPPVPLNTPPVSMPKPKPATPAQTEQIRRYIGDAIEQQEAAVETSKAEAKFSGMPQSVQQAIAHSDSQQVRVDMKHMADKRTRPAPPPAKPAPQHDVLVDLPAGSDDIAAYERMTQTLPTSERLPIMQQPPGQRPNLGGQPPLSPPAPQEEELPPEDPELPEASVAPEDVPLGEQAGADIPVENCPHCEMPLDMPSIPPPPYAERMAFLHSVLGQIPYRHEYPIFGGNAVLTLRTLTTRELDCIFAAVDREVRAEKIRNRSDYWERINRLRLLVQTVSFKGDGFDHQLPDGLTPELHPRALLHWSSCGMPEPQYPSDVGLESIEKWMLDNVFLTEPVHRVAVITCNKFNRIVAKMEGLSDNPGFWSATEAQS